MFEGRSTAGYDVRMARLFQHTQTAVREERYLVGWHADETCEERGITEWQNIVGLKNAELRAERKRVM